MRSWGKTAVPLVLALSLVGGAAGVSAASAARPAQGDAGAEQGDPNAARGDTAVSGDHADGGESLTDLAEVDTPEQVEQRRQEIAERLSEAGSAAELARLTEREALVAMAELDGQIVEAQNDLAAAAAASTAADAALVEASEAEAEATERARRAGDAAREAAVDMFIYPPQADEVRAALSGTVEEQMAATGLLIGRADARRELSRLTDRARAAAERAEGRAEEARAAAEDAEVAAEEAAETLRAQMELRNIRLRQIRTDIAALEAELGSLEITDHVLAVRLYVDALAGSGSASPVVLADGTWIPRVEGLPTKADMVRITGTSMWVHHLVAPDVEAMVAAAFADGVVLQGSSFRDTNRQIELRRSHCGSSYDAVFNAPSSSCSPPTARPGFSMHERGLAIDFSEGGRALGRSSAAFAWLAENAADYGFFNLPSEPWHWSVNGN